MGGRRQAGEGEGTVTTEEEASKASSQLGRFPTEEKEQLKRQH